MITLELNNITKTYDSPEGTLHAVKGVSWSAHGGEIFGLLGPNGAGKTSMIRVVLDLLRPNSGEVLIDGDALANRTLLFRRRIGYLPEERGLYRNRTILEVLQYFGVLKGLSIATCRQRSDELLERFGLTAVRKRKIEQLSKGMGQKVQIISCILHDPDLVILDEPFSGLDPLNVRLVRQLILDLKKSGKLVCLSTHMMSEVEALCDRVCMLNRGDLVLYGDLPSIRAEFSKSENVPLHHVHLEDVFVHHAREQ